MIGQRIAAVLVLLLIPFGASCNRGPTYRNVVDAVAAGDTKAVERLLKKSGNPDAHEEGETHPLVLAVYMKDPKSARLLLDAGVDVNATMPVDIMSAVIEGVQTETPWWLPQNPDSVDEMLSGPEFEALRQPHVTTPLALAAESGQEDMVQLLLSYGANIDQRVWLGTRPLHQAAFYGKSQVVEILIANGADLNATDDAGNTAISYAAGQGSTDVLRLLLVAGADPQQTGDTGHTAPYSAAMYDRTESLQFLLENGVALDFPNPHNGLVPLHGAALENAEKSIEFLIQHGSNVNVASKAGVTPLHVAASAGHLDAVEQLLSLGADRSLTMRNGSTAGDIARKYGHQDIAELLDRR